MSGGAPLHGGKAVQGTVCEGQVIALIQAAVRKTRILTALRARYLVHFVQNADELLAKVRTTVTPIHGIIVETSDERGRAVAETVRAIASTEQSPPIVAYCHAAAAHSAEIRSLVLAGAHELIFDGVDDSGVALRAILDSAEQIRLGERAAAQIKPLLQERLWPFVDYVTAVPTTQLVAQVADALGYNRKTLGNHCAQAHAPAPHELLVWCRLCVVAELLATTTRTIEAIALQLDFPSDSALRNMFKRYTGGRASDVRTKGGPECVVAAFRRALVLSRKWPSATG